jgi:RNA polymerase sigma-70 factor (ECF subfamily)
MLKLMGRPAGQPALAKKLPAGARDALAALARSCRQGDRAAARTMLATVGPSMLQMVRRVLGPKDRDVEDVLQEALIAFVNALPGFRSESTVKHFACRIATLTALKTLRGRPRDPMCLSEPDEEVWNGVDPDSWAQASMRRHFLRRMLGQLPELQAEAMVLHYVAGLSVEEMATDAQIPAETIRSRLRLAREALRTRIAADPSLAEVLEDAP